jgi:uncharacterized protein
LSSSALPQLQVVRAYATRVAPWLCAGLFLVTALCVSAQTWEAGTDGLLPIPPLSARVTDLTHTLSASEQSALETKLADWETRTSNQLVVLIVPTTQPEPIEAYSIRVAEKWKIGRKGQDNGVLFLIAKNDRKMRIEVGYGLEGVLPDVTAKRIIAEDVAPAFREGKFAQGINIGVDRIVAVVGGEFTAPSRTAQPRGNAAQPFSFETLFVLLFIVVPLVGRLLRGIFGRLAGSTIGAGIVGGAAWLFAGSLGIAIVAAIVGFIVMIFFGIGGGLSRGGTGGIVSGGGWGGGGFSGGGFSGGGGGGFSGGGGSFGGGGASGDW